MASMKQCYTVPQMRVFVIDTTDKVCFTSDDNLQELGLKDGDSSYEDKSSYSKPTEWAKSQNRGNSIWDD